MSGRGDQPNLVCLSYLERLNVLLSSAAAMLGHFFPERDLTQTIPRIFIIILYVGPIMLFFIHENLSITSIIVSGTSFFLRFVERGK